MFRLSAKNPLISKPIVETDVEIPDISFLSIDVNFALAPVLILEPT